MVFGSNTNRDGLEVVDALGVVGAKVVGDLVVVDQAAAKMIHACRTVGNVSREKAGYESCKVVPPFMPACDKQETGCENCVCWGQGV